MAITMHIVVVVHKLVVAYKEVAAVVAYKEVAAVVAYKEVAAVVA
jgi:hypothetical protein